MDPFGSQRKAGLSSTDWPQLRRIVRELYHSRRWNMAQVCDHLEVLGYHVNTRMVRTRTTQWNFQKNNQTRGMVAALGPLNPETALWPSLEPIFLIRGRQVTMNNILRFFRRKGIQNPIQWAWSATHERGRDEPVVRLLHKDNADANANDPSATAAIIMVGSMQPRPTTSSSSAAHGPSCRFPSTFHQRAVASLRDYCMAYVGLGRASVDREPEVHQLNIYGRFGDRMQEGLGQMVRRGPGAFPHFHCGFDLVQPLLSECHPMGLAQFLAVVCKLVVCAAPPFAVLAPLVRYCAAMASSLPVPETAKSFLRDLSISSPHMLLLSIVSSLKDALAVFSEHASTTWQRLYIQERLCDCLYHGREHTEGGGRRAQLLEDQEAFYGPFARNVLWTMTNFADDRLKAGGLDNSRRYYSLVIARAEHLTGFGRAKLRFAALEGLARAERKHLEELCGNTRPIDMDGTLVSSNLQNMRRYLDDALNEALIWFEPTSRRITRTKEQRSHFRSLLEVMGCQELVAVSTPHSNELTLWPTMPVETP